MILANLIKNHDGNPILTAEDILEEIVDVCLRFPPVK